MNHSLRTALFSLLPAVFLFSALVSPHPYLHAASPEKRDLLEAQGAPVNLLGVHGEGVSIPYPPEEEFEYDVRFLWFIQAAYSRLRIRRTSERKYLVEMVAETKGLVGLLSSYRKNVYASEMDYVPEDGRFITRRFTKVVIWGGNIKKTTSENDYEQREHRWEVIENGKMVKKGREPIPPGVIYEDLLSAFFNLRNGAFGPLKRGRRITVTSQPYIRIPGEAPDDAELEFSRNFVIRIADRLTEQKNRIRFERTKERGLLLLVNVPSDFFGQNTGKVLVWLNRQLIPVAARVEDVVLFGDVCGTLRKRPIKRSKDFVLGAPKGFWVETQHQIRK